MRSWEVFVAVSPLTSHFYCGRDRVSKDRPGILVLYPDCVSLSSIAQSCPNFCDPMDYSTIGCPVHHQHPKLTQTHAYQVSDAIQPWVRSPGSTEGLPAFAQGGDLLLYAVFIAYNKGKATSPTGLSFSTAPPLILND